MDAMAMPFDLKGRRAARGADGRRSRALRLAVKGGRSWVDRLEVISAAPVDAGLQQTPVTHVLVPVGATLPDFELTDQAGGAAQPVVAQRQGCRRQLHLHAVPAAGLLSPDGRELPRDSRAVRRPHGRDLVLLTVSFDPEVRHAAGDWRSMPRRMRAGGPGWHFLTGDAANIERVCNAFGIQYFPERG